MPNPHPPDSGSEPVRPGWPAPPAVKACTTTRRFPSAIPPARGTPASVAANRRRLSERLGLPNEPVWLEQVHGRQVVRIDRGTAHAPRADAAWTDTPGVVCAVLTADCLPVLLCERHAREVAAVHGGWRGLQQGIIGATIESLNSPASDLLAWLGPAISADAYEVDAQVREAFSEWDVDFAFKATRPGHWTLDLYAVAREQLNRAGVEAVYGGDYCTFNHSELFFSYRRERQTGRMASLIWIAPE